MRHKLFWGSSYDRGLDILLNMWPKIIEKYPDTLLVICYGWDMFIKGYANNPERMNWMERMEKLMKQKGITHYGRVGKNALKVLRKDSTIWAYPTYFCEINCITALECQSDGVVPVVIKIGALDETVQSGIKIEGDIYDEETQDEFLQALYLLLGKPDKWKEESKKAKEFTRNYSWEKIAKEWGKQFE